MRHPLFVMFISFQTTLKQKSVFMSQHFNETIEINMLNINYNTTIKHGIEVKNK